MADQETAMNESDKIIEALGIKRLRWIHTVIAGVLLVACLAFMALYGGALFKHIGQQIGHGSDMLVFGLIAFFMIGLALYVMRFTHLQGIFLPYADELRDITAAWRAGQKPSQAEAWLALGWAVVTGCTILGALIAIALVATPL